MSRNNTQQFLGLMVSVLLCLGFVCTPAAVQAQSFAADEQYRAVLLALIETLQAQIELLQEQLVSQKSIEAIVNQETGVQSGTVFANAPVLNRYAVANESDVQNISDSTHREYLARVYEVFPDEYDQKLTEFLIFEDTEGDYGAFVQTIPPDHDQWSFAIGTDLLGRENTESNTILIVHELAHIISYESIVSVPLPSNASCHVYFQTRGCPKKNSYLAIFTETFWSSADLDRALQFTQRSDAMSAADEYFHSTDNQYVSGYAAMNPEEDFAESFAQYALSRGNQTGSLVSEKVWWFEQFAELQNIRQFVK